MYRLPLIAFLAALSLAAGACGSSSETAEAEPAATETEVVAEAEVDDETASEVDDSEPDDVSDEVTETPSAAFDVDAILAADLDDCVAEPTGEALRIGYAADFSELGGFVDIPASAAAEYFVDLFNCSGGVDGRPIELTVRDIEGDPETAGLVAQELVGENVTAILGPAFFDVNQAILQVTAGTTPFISVSSTEPLLADPTQLSLLASFTDTKQAEAAAQFAIDQGWMTAATFSVPGPYFGYLVEVFNEEYQALGGTLVGDYPFVPVETVDFSAQVNEIAALDVQPDVVYSGALAFQAAILASQLDEAGIETEMLVADAFSATGGYFTDGVEGFFHTSHTFPDPDGRMVTFLNNYEELNGEVLESDSYSALAADAILVIADAVLRTGSIDQIEVGEAMLAGTGVDGLTGTLAYNGGATPNTPVYVHEVVDGGPTLAAVYE